MHVYIYIYIYIGFLLALSFSIGRSLGLSLHLSRLLTMFQAIDTCGIWTHAACASGTWVHPLRPLGQRSLCVWAWALPLAPFLSFPHTRAHALTTTTNTRDTPWPLYPQIFFRNEELCQWLVGHVPGIEGSGHCGSTLLWAFVSLGAAQPTIHAFFTHTRPHRTTTNTRDTPCPSSTLGKIFD